MAEQMTTKQLYQAYLRGEASLEQVEKSAQETLAKYRNVIEPPPNSESRDS